MANLTRRAIRTAEASPIGRDMIGFVERPDIREKLLTAADDGLPPVLAITDDALTTFPAATFDDHMNRRRLGLLVAATLDELGYEPARSNVRIKNSVFSSGSTYKKKIVAPVSSEDFVRRFVSVLTEQEADRAMDAIVDRFPKLRNKLRR